MSSFEPKIISYLRFSTPEQALGDSTRRQMEVAQRWADKLGLTLDETIKDEGLSGFKAAHMKKGALGRFLVRVKQGEIPPGSVLVIEAFDRLGREKPSQGFKRIQDLLEAGLKIVTGIDGQIYSQENVDDDGKLYNILGALKQAHSESSYKSVRVGDAWANKRRLARENLEPISRSMPGWLDLVVDANKKKRYVIIEARAEIVRRIFRESAMGLGKHSITKRLNEEKVPTFRYGKSWHISTVQKILGSDGVLGVYHPHEETPEGRKPSGPPIKDYYPRIIEDDLWFAAQRSMEGRANLKIRGRTGQKASSPFSKVAFCGGCGGPLVHWNPGERRKRDGKMMRKLLCGAARRGLPCESPKTRHNFQAAFIHIFHSVDAFRAAHLPIDEMPTLHRELATVKRELMELNSAQDDLMATQKRAGIKITVIENELLNNQLEINRLEEKKLNLEKEVNIIEQEKREASKDNESILDLINRAFVDTDEEDNEERYLERQQAAELTRRIIHRVVFEADEKGETSGYWITLRTPSGRPDTANTFYVPETYGFIWARANFYDFCEVKAKGLLETLEGDLPAEHAAYLKRQLAALLAQVPRLRVEPYITAVQPQNWFSRAWIDRSAEERVGDQSVLESHIRLGFELESLSEQEQIIAGDLAAKYPDMFYVD